MTIDSSFWKKVFIVLIALALFFHVFNTLQVTENIKVFHLFAIGAIIVGLFLKGENNNVQLVFLSFVAWTFFSSLLSPISISFISGVKFSIVSLSTFFITKVPAKRLIRTVNNLTPIILIVLLVHYFRESVLYRYEGFYEDPNYLCTTLLVLLFFILLAWNETYRRFNRIFLILEILIIAFLITRTISRTGLLCFALMIVGFGWNLLKRNRFKALIGIVLVVGGFLYFRPDIAKDAVSSYMRRETENSDTIISATDFRWEISKRGLTFISSRPRYFLIGIGVGSYSSAKELPGWYAPTDHMDHNTFTSCLSEQGFIGLLLYLSFLILLLKNLFKSSFLREHGLSIVVIISLLSLLLFSVSINQFSYLPYWFLIMTLVNLSQIKKSED